MDSLYLAVDAGGTRTTYLLADDEGLLARTTGGSIKRMRVSAAEADRNLEDALLQLEEMSGWPMSDVTATCIGVAGQTVPLVRDWVQSAFGERVGGSLLLGGDVDIALDAAFRGGRGVLVLAGTGSNVLARAEDGNVFNVGGWGPMLGDQGSGYWIGREALMMGFRAVNDGRPSYFLEHVMDAWDTDSLEGIVAIAHREPAPDFAALSTLVSQMADAGDEDSRKVLVRAGDELARQVASAMERMRASEGAEADDAWQPPAIACAGSVLEHIGLLRHAMTMTLEEAYPHVDVLPGVVDPVMGALWRVRGHEAFPVTEEVR